MSGQPTIPFNRPQVVGRELEYIREAVELGNIAGDGHFTNRCAELLQELLSTPVGDRDRGRVLMTPSCTAALEMALWLCELQEGDEVIVPSFTFVSTANAVLVAGGRPVFCDVRPDTLNLDERQLPELVTDRTRAIIPVHYAGVACEMSAILSIAEQHDLIVIEDAAQAIGATYHGEALGGLGHAGAFSFHETKNVVCGEGGALAVNHAAWVERAEIIRDKGTDRKKFFRGEVQKYRWVDIGSSYVPSEIACAFLCAQLECMDTIRHRRRQLYERYLECLAPIELSGRGRLPVVPDGCQSNCHLFYLLAEDEETRDGLLVHLRSHGIHAVFHYTPLHSSPMGKKYHGTQGHELPVTDRVSRTLLRLPIFYAMSDEQQARVIDTTLQFFA